LTLDVFTARGVIGGKTCLYPAPPEIVEDVYRALNWLVTQKNVDQDRIFVVGFGRAGTVALSAAQRDIEAKTTRRFRGAIAFYPSCRAEKGIMAMATLVIVGALDKVTSEACRKMARGEDDIGISRRNGDGIPVKFAALPDAHSGFDVPTFQQPVEARGFHFEFSNSATEQSKVILRDFLRSAGQ
jgi:dienelactone hydrolase